MGDLGIAIPIEPFMRKDKCSSNVFAGLNDQLNVESKFRVINHFKVPRG